MPPLVRWCPFLLLAHPALAVGLPASAQSLSSSPLTPAAETKLRNLLPLPEAALNSDMEMSVGLRPTPGHGAQLFREGRDYAAQVAVIRRGMTGAKIKDAARCQELGELYRRAGLPEKSAEAFRQDEALCRAVLKQRPDDGPALAEYGWTLQATGRMDTAEAFLQKAAQTAPISADVWMALGGVLSSQASRKPESKLRKAHQANLAYDKAVSVAPGNPETWTARGNFRCWTLPRLQGRMPSTAGLSDFQRAAALAPNDPYKQVAVPDIEGMTFEMSHHFYTSPEAAKQEPAEYDRQAKRAIQRVTAIAESTTGEQSAGAYDARSWVQFEFSYDFYGAQKSLRLALRQDPQDQGARGYQIHVAAVTGDYPLMAAFCRRELRRRPQVYLHVLLADADSHLAQQKPRYWQEARAQMELAHAAAPHDDALRLGLAALLLKSGQQPDLSRAAVLLNEIAPSSPLRNKSQQAEYDLTRGISAALSGHTEEARRFLSAALQDDPHNQPAKSALALLPTAVTIL